MLALTYKFNTASPSSDLHPNIGATFVGIGGDWSPQLLGWVTNNVLAQLLGCSF